MRIGRTGILLAISCFSAVCLALYIVNGPVQQLRWRKHHALATHLVQQAYSGHLVEGAEILGFPDHINALYVEGIKVAAQRHRAYDAVMDEIPKAVKSAVELGAELEKASPDYQFVSTRSQEIYSAQEDLKASLFKADATLRDWQEQIYMEWATIWPNHNLDFSLKREDRSRPRYWQTLGKMLTHNTQCNRKLFEKHGEDTRWASSPNPDYVEKIAREDHSDLCQALIHQEDYARADTLYIVREKEPSAFKVKIEKSIHRLRTAIGWK